ncbi:MAG: NCS2 family permease, partial [Bacillota bacterium]|nr:NCS2 family permease [Bacillota bacterium]
MSKPQDGFLENFFKLSEHKTDVKTEVLAGLTTFITMGYIIFVNPIFLSDAGIPHGAAITATILAAAFATILMGIYANFPIALAPGMGVNAYFAYGIVLGMGVPWETALGAVFISGIIFLLLTVTKARQAIVKAVPQSLRSAIAVGIGLFIAFIGFKNAGIVVGDQATLVALGNFSEPRVLLALFGLVFTGYLVSRKVKGSFLIGILATTILAMIFKVDTAAPTAVGDVVGAPPSILPTLLQMDVMAALGIGLITVIFSLTFVDLFDT